MNNLAGANLPFVEGGGGSSDAGSSQGDAGADGTGADGAPIVNATLQFTDVNGKTVTTTTDAKGYYRISLRGMKAPLVATVMRNGNPWKSMLVNDITRAPANRKFFTINLTGLTDVVVSELARKDGLSSPEAVTPAAVARQKSQVPGIVSALNTSISGKIIAAGLNPATFAPLTDPFVPDKAGYDMVLETVTVTKVPGQFTTVSPKTVAAICANQTSSGSGALTKTFDFGNIGFPINFKLSMSPYSAPDRFRVTQGGMEIYNSTFISTVGGNENGFPVTRVVDGVNSPQLTLNGGSTSITVIVEQPLSGGVVGSGTSVWDYSIVCN